MAKVNLSRGLFRAWLVLAVIWTGVIGWNAYSNWYAPYFNWYDPGDDCSGVQFFSDAEVGLPPNPQQEAQLAKERAKIAECRAAKPISERLAFIAAGYWLNIKASLPLALLPPLALLLAGYIFGWIVKGFGVKAESQ
jgi:hypothetical protein